MRTVDEWKSALRVAMKDALRARQPGVVAVMRETLAAIDNAEAAELSAAPKTQDGVIAGGVAGLGAGEVQRRSLTPEEVEAIVTRELAELRASAATYEGLGRGDEAGALRSKAEALARLHSPNEF